MEFPNLLLFYQGGRPVAFLRAKIVSSQDELEQGLSGIDKLDRNAGMVFLFSEPHTVKMQMRETKIPLDMMFVDADGRIMHIEENAVPMSDDLYGPEITTYFVVEANGGWCAYNGIGVGTIIGIA